MFGLGGAYEGLLLVPIVSVHMASVLEVVAGRLLRELQSPLSDGYARRVGHYPVRAVAFRVPGVSCCAAADG